jgi:hypothetical protein
MPAPQQTTATYYYCEHGVSKSVVVTLLLGSESQFFAQYIGVCYVIKKRRKLTVSLPVGHDELPVDLNVTYQYLSTESCPPYLNQPSTMTETLTIQAGASFAERYVESFISWDCPGDYDSGDGTSHQL